MPKQYRRRLAVTHLGDTPLDPPLGWPEFADALTQRTQFTPVMSHDVHDI